MTGTVSVKTTQWESPGHREDVLAVLDDQFAGRPEVRRGKVFGFPAFSTGGKVFAIAFGDGVALKLPQETIDRLADDEIAPFRPMGKTMGGWVQISRPEAESYAADFGLFEISLAYAAAQASQPKPMPRQKKAA
jgi:hypothetical protein